MIEGMIDGHRTVRTWHVQATLVFEGARPTSSVQPAALPAGWTRSRTRS
jgi:hypothetical protein